MARSLNPDLNLTFPTHVTLLKLLCPPKKLFTPETISTLTNSIPNFRSRETRLTQKKDAKSALDQRLENLAAKGPLAKQGESALISSFWLLGCDGLFCAEAMYKEIEKEIKSLLDDNRKKIDRIR